FDLFKIGIGPSSSHTVGPMRAARRFAQMLEAFPSIERVRVELYGSLALTGRGHGTDRAILLGLSGEQPDQVDPAAVDGIVEAIRTHLTLNLGGSRSIPFDEAKDIAFHMDLMLPGHSNGMRFVAYAPGAQELLRKVFYSVGGGFVVEEGQAKTTANEVSVPYGFQSSAELLEMCARTELSIPELMFENEKAWRSADEIRSGILRIWQVMRDCTQRGLHTEGVLPGGLGVRRRAPAMLARLEQRRQTDSLAAMDWLNLYAMAVNEENAAGGRVVTAPTNGAAGVIPAVAHYYVNFLNGDEEGIIRYFLAAAAIGVLYKEHASISGAEVGCQGEVGVACSMAAGGLVAAQKGTNLEIEHAAEIGMEHNLGMTCDPIGGLVQIPCIERNAFGAMKAVNAARMALEETLGHKVSLDQVIKTMYQTGLDMQSKYKETSLAGLAVNVVEC
ncbi:MAG TPA: L-serine ammonia-lyase, partial [Bryobacteraceae bacterium]